MPRSLEEMLGNYDIEVVPVGESYIVTWKSIGSDDSKAQVFTSQKDADRFALDLNPTRSIGILRMHFSRGEMPSYDELRNARRAERELERELRDSPSVLDRIRAIIAVYDLQLALRDAERTEPTYLEMMGVEQALLDLKNALRDTEPEPTYWDRVAADQAILDLENSLEAVEPIPERVPNEIEPSDYRWGGRRSIRVRSHRRGQR